MKRIKQIIEALKVISTTPSETIRSAVISVMGAAARDGGVGRADQHLIGNVLDAVVGIAEDMEKPAKGEETKA